MRSTINNLKSISLNTKNLKKVLIVCTVIVGVAYIWQVNASSTVGFTMRDLQSDIEDLQLEQERLNLQVAQLQSVDSVSQRVQMLGLSKIKTVEYLHPGNGSVAINR